MPISKIPVGAIQSGTIGTSQIADDAVTTAKILNDNVTSAKIPNDAVGSTEISSNAVTRDELQSAAVNNISSDSIILNSTNGTADAGDFLVLDGTDNSSTNANHRILYDETFNPSTFNVSGTATAGNAIKVKSGGGFEFGAAGGLVLLETKSVASGSATTQPFHFSNIFSSTYRNYKVIYNVKETESSANAGSAGLVVRLGNAGTLSTGTSSTCKHSLMYCQGDATADSIVYGDSDDIFVLCQNFSSNEDMTTSGECTFMNMLDTDFQGSCISSTMMHGETNSYYYEHGLNMIINKATTFTDISFEIKVTGGGGGGNMDHSTTGYNVFGEVKVYGII
tara:strand:- start:320 stop:1330 length:1011 start_codon:yes stop_codon:yes gene_type:complete